nr:MAG TPA: hypothetical protein [Caudoviricetes sp.]
MSRDNPGANRAYVITIFIYSNTKLKSRQAACKPICP